MPRIPIPPPTAKSGPGALDILRALAEPTRLSIIQSLWERDLYAELLAERLGLSQATVSHHMKQLMLAGLVSARKQQYYVIYSINKERFSMTLEDLSLGAAQAKTDEAQREALYRQKVLGTFMKEGRCPQFPVQRKKLKIILEEIIGIFEFDRDYTEKEVNALLEPINPDFCTLRRELIDEQLMTRTRNIYRRLRPGESRAADPLSGLL